MTNQPLYKKVESYIRDHISSHQWVPGDLIPSESRLSEKLDVSIGTVRKAIDILEQEKLLYRHQGKGTYVSRIDFDRSLFRFFSYGTATGESARIHKVTPSLQKEGLGRLLMHEVESLLLARGCPKINLQIRNSNLEAAKFYRTIGYEIDDSVGMGKRLIPDN